MIRPIPVIIPAARNLTVIHSIGGELRQLEKGRARVEQCPHPLARQRFATSGMPPPGLFGAAGFDGGDFRAQVLDECAHRSRVCGKQL